MPTDVEKIQVYEAILHRLYMARCVSLREDIVIDALDRIDRWSRACGGGEFSDEEIDERIELAFQAMKETIKSS